MKGRQCMCVCVCVCVCVCACAYIGRGTNRITGKSHTRLSFVRLMFDCYTICLRQAAVIVSDVFGRWPRICVKIKTLSLYQAVEACKVVRRIPHCVDSRQSAHRWRLGCQALTKAALYPQKSSGTHLCYRLSKLRSRGGSGRILFCKLQN
jgi:hypothetical protein